MALESVGAAVDRQTEVVAAFQAAEASTVAFQASSAFREACRAYPAASELAFQGEHRECPRTADAGDRSGKVDSKGFNKYIILFSAMYYV